MGSRTPGGDLEDGASEFLEFARNEKRANQKELDSIIKSTAQFAFQKGISTTTEVSRAARPILSLHGALGSFYLPVAKQIRSLMMELTSNLLVLFTNSVLSCQIAIIQGSK
jgi:hypothetical protein